MGLPSKRRTKSQAARRASHHALSAPAFTACSNCGKPVRPHHVCLACGYYQGRKVLTTSSKAEKRLRKRERARKKEEAEAAEPNA